MMKRILLSIVMSCCILLTSFRPDGEWIVFASEPGHFAISLPGEPTNEIIEGDIHMLSYSARRGVYLLAWRDMHTYFPTNDNQKKTLKESMNEVTASIAATNVTTLATETSGPEPHIDFTFNTNEYLGKCRIYIINEFQYTLIATGPLKAGFTPNLDRFIGSFRHLP